MSAARRRRERSPAGRSAFVAGLVVIAATITALCISFTGGLPLVGRDDGRIVKAVFATANEVDGRTPVRVDGVHVGRVNSVRLAPDGRSSIVTMRITEDAVDLRRDARAQVRWRTLLGGSMAIELTPGSSFAGPLRGDTIPRSRTTSQIELDDLLQTYQGTTVQAQRDVLAGLAGGLRGDDAARFVESLPVTLRPLAPALRGLRGRRADDLGALVRGTASSLRATGRAERALRAFVSGGRRTFGTFAGERLALGRIIERAPAAMDATVAGAQSIDATLPAIDALVGELRPAARALAPAVEATRPTLTTLSTVLDDARPLLARLRPALTDLGAASRAGVRVVDGLSPTVRRLQLELLPLLRREDADSGLPLHQMVAPTIAALGASAAYFDRSSHLLNFPLTVGENALSALPCRTTLTDPTEAQKLRCSQLGESIERLLGGGGR